MLIDSQSEKWQDSGCRRTQGKERVMGEDEPQRGQRKEAEFGILRLGLALLGFVSELPAVTSGTARTESNFP